MRTMVAKQSAIDPENIKRAFAAKLDSASFTSWIAPLKFEIINNNVLLLSAQNQFSADFIGSVHLGTLNSIAAGFGLTVKLVVASAGKSAKTSLANDNNVQSFSSPTKSSVTSSVTDAGGIAAFDSFITSEENAFVVSACKKLATGKVPFSPLFIYGPAGSGKSLLMDAIESASFGRTVKMTGSQFISEFTRSLQDRTIFAFKDFCRDCDIFILDDVQTLAGKNASCSEFLQLIMDLRSLGKNIVLTANAAPGALVGFDRHICSLFASGLVADITAPNVYVKKTILIRAGVSADVAEFLSRAIVGDGHLLSGVATKIKTYSELMGTTVNMEIAQHLLSDTLAKSKTPLAMVKSMCEKLAVSYDAICSGSRSRGLVLARQIIMAVLRGATNLSLAEIGYYVGNRNHASVLYALKQIEKLQKSDLTLTTQIAQLISEYDCPSN